MTKNISNSKSIEDKVHESLSDKKRFLELAIFSVIESMRNKPDKYSSLVYHNNMMKTQAETIVIVADRYYPHRHMTVISLSITRLYS
jgi:hypothetical protein